VAKVEYSYEVKDDILLRRKCEYCGSSIESIFSSKTFLKTVGGRAISEERIADFRKENSRKIQQWFLEDSFALENYGVFCPSCHKFTSSSGSHFAEGYREHITSNRINRSRKKDITKEAILLPIFLTADILVIFLLIFFFDELWIFLSGIEDLGSLIIVVLIGGLITCGILLLFLFTFVSFMSLRVAFLDPKTYKINDRLSNFIVSMNEEDAFSIVAEACIKAGNKLRALATDNVDREYKEYLTGVLLSRFGNEISRSECKQVAPLLGYSFDKDFFQQSTGHLSYEPGNKLSEKGETFSQASRSSQSYLLIPLERICSFRLSRCCLTKMSRPSWIQIKT
jgi:hypothetical protein